MPQLWNWDSMPRFLLGSFITTQALSQESSGDWEPFGRKQTRHLSRLLLTCQADQHSTHKQVYHQLTTLRHSGHKERDDDLGWDIELQGISEEDADGVEQLNRLVQPAERAKTHSKVYSACSDTAVTVQNGPSEIWPYYPSYKCTCPLDPAISRDLSCRHTYLCKNLQNVLLQHYVSAKTENSVNVYQ